MKHGMKVLTVVQGTDEWLEERMHCVTGTRFQSAIGASYSKKSGWVLGKKSIQDTLKFELVSEYQSILEIDDYCNASMQRGKDLEPHSINAASVKMGKNFVECGMLQSTVFPEFKYSPDAVCYSEKFLDVIEGGYETKSENGALHIQNIIGDIVPHKHLWQCICPMVMSDDVKWWAFGSYDDRNKVNPIWIKKIYREDLEDVIEEAREILALFIEDVKAECRKIGGAYNG